MISKLWRAIIDIFYLMRLRLKIIGKDYITLIVLFGSLFIFLIIVRSLTLSMEELSSLPVGIVDYDDSESSRNLISALQKAETIRIIEEEEPELKKLLLDEMITSVFIINRGYEKKLQSGDLNKIITMYYKEDNKAASIISDIVAGEILSPACLYKSYHYYDQLNRKGEKLTLEEYRTYITEVMNTSEEFNFALKMEYNNPANNAVSEDELSNTILYRQFIFGILGLMMEFLAMFIVSQTVNEKEKGITQRLNITGFRILKRDLGNLCALTLIEGIISLCFTWLIAMQLKLEDPILWFRIIMLLLLNAISVGGILLLLSKIIKRIATYQVVCTIIILLTGGVGFYHILSGFYKGFIEVMVKFIPNSWFIKGFTDIIIYGNKQFTQSEGQRMLCLMAISVILLVIGIDFIQQPPITNKRNRLDGKINGQEYKNY